MTAMNLPIEQAHMFGRDLDVTASRALTRRALAQLVTALPNMWEQIARRCIQQAMEEALPTYWLARAEQMERVGTPAADEAARNCRRHAWLLAQGMPDDLAAEVDEALNVITKVVA